jgi:3-oxoacid CoA-transferase
MGLRIIETLIAAMHRRGVNSLNNLTAVSNNAGAGSAGLSPLVLSGQISKCIASFLGNNKALEKKYLNGEISIELCPQGTLAERIRAAGAGIPAFYTPTGVGKMALIILQLCGFSDTDNGRVVDTLIQTGGIPVRLGRAENGSDVITLEKGNARETRVFDGKTYNMETALKGDVAILRAYKVDEAGNCVFR